MHAEPSLVPDRKIFEVHTQALQMAWNWAKRRGLRVRKLIQIVKSADHSLQMTGESGYHTTPSGKTRVYHPNAYKWRTVYHCSTLACEVTEAWVQEAGRSKLQPVDGVPTYVVARGHRLHGLRVRKGWMAHDTMPTWVVEGRGWAFHARRSGGVTPRQAAMEAIQAIRKRREAEALKSQELQSLTTTWLTPQHARQSGACEPGTAAAQAKVEAALGAMGPVGAVRADVALTILGDSEYHVRRAIKQAQQINT